MRSSSLKVRNKQAETVREDLDPRVVRTTHVLGRALVELIQEEDFGSITVQSILDRAGVGRTTFYAHYRNKEDVLHTSFEHAFGYFESVLDESPSDKRLFPVAEFLSHIRDMSSFVTALEGSGQMQDLWALCNSFASRLIERRMGGPPSAPHMSRRLLAEMLAGALLSSIKWWHEHQGAATPEKVDAAFHAFAAAVILRPPKGE